MESKNKSKNKNKKTKIKYVRLPKKCLSKDGFIINQGMLKKIPYGNYTSDKNGCGWIAVYNAMKLLGYKDKPQASIHFLENYMILNGKYGTKAKGIKKYLKKKGMKLKCTYCRRKMIKYKKCSNVGIILYWGNKYVHYVAFRRNGDKYHFYNDIYGKENDIRSMKKFYHDNKIKIGYIINVCNKK